MRTSRLTTYALLALLALLSCKSNPLSQGVEESLSETTSTKQSTASSGGSTSTASTTSVAVTSTTSEEVTSITSEVVTLADKVKSFYANNSMYGNTNGNSSNLGLAVFNHRAKVHYYAYKSSVYEYRPTTDETFLLFSNDDPGYITNLCLLDNDLYYVTTTSNFLYRYNLLSTEKILVHEYETSEVFGYYQTIFLRMKKVYYSDAPIPGIGSYNHARKEQTGRFNAGVTTINLTDTKVIYTDNYAPTLNLMADNFMGKTTIKYFGPEPLSFDELRAVNLFSSSSTSPTVLTFVLYLRKGTESALYLYNTGDQALVTIIEGEDIHSMNSDGEYVYFIKDDSLYRYDVATASLTMLKSLFVGARYVQVINHWLYVGHETLSTLYRIHPDTGSISTDFWMIEQY